MKNEKYEWHAWGDESLRTIAVERPVYLLGAVIAEPAACDVFRDQMRRLKQSERKLHWRNLDRAHRKQVISVVSTLDTFSVVVMGSPVEARKQERARMQCLERLAWELCERHVTSLILESRPKALMSADRRMIDILRSRAALSPTLRVDHGLPSNEPMLWIADQILGAVGDALTGRDEWLTALGTSVEVVGLELA